MIQFTNPHIDIATQSDAVHIADLLNAAYRGESSKKGWTTEAHLIAGNTRTDVPNLLQVMNKTRSVVLKYSNYAGDIMGCINLQQQSDKIYLGMFSVSPQLQGAGIGKQLLQAAEEYALQLSCTTIYMSVISVRKELIEWYIRHGYHDTGERKAFCEDALTGRHLQLLEFMMLEKNILIG